MIGEREGGLIVYREIRAGYWSRGGRFVRIFVSAHLDIMEMDMSMR